MSQLQTKFIANNAITNAKLAQAPANTIKGNNTGGTANELDLTVAQVQTMLSIPTNSSPLAINAGGTGQTSASAAFNALSPITTTGDMIYSASGATNSRLPIGSTNQVLTVISGVPSWQTPATGGTVTSVSVTSANGFAGTVATATTTPAITISTTVTGFLQGNGTSISAATTTGTGSTLVLSAGPTFTGILNAANTSFTAPMNMNSNLIENVANGVANTDAANYGQVLAIAAGLSWKNNVLVATTANITLSGEQTIDGFLTSSSRVLVKNQTTTADNGIYVSASGAWTRATDMNTWAQVPATVVATQEGTVNGDLAFICTSAPGGTLGTTAITFTSFGSYLADGSTLALTGNVFSVASSGIGTTQLAANGVTNAKLAQMPTLTLKGNNTGGTANALDLTVSQVQSMLSIPTASSPLPVGSGGTGLTTLTAHAIQLGNGTSSPTQLAAGAAGTILQGNGTSVDPSFSASPTIGIAGTSSGQLNFTALTSGAISLTVPASTATYTMVLPNSAGSSGQFLTSQGGGVAMVWTTPTVVPAATEDILTLSSGDITNQYKDLSFAATGSSGTVNSISLDVYGGPQQLKGTDYTVSLTGGAGGVTRITFAGDLATGGNAALVAGDILMVEYTH